MVEKNELEPDQYEVRSDGMIRLKPGAYFYPSQVEIRIVKWRKKSVSQTVYNNNIYRIKKGKHR